MTTKDMGLVLDVIAITMESRCMQNGEMKSKTQAKKQYINKVFKVHLRIYITFIKACRL
jgi:hypothetical protein